MEDYDWGILSLLCLLFIVAILPFIIGESPLQETIQNINESIVKHNASKIEEKLQELTSNGCECGNKKDFVLVYCEQDFKYIRCDHCGRHHYVPEVYTSEHIENILSLNHFN